MSFHSPAIDVGHARPPLASSHKTRRAVSLLTVLPGITRRLLVVITVFAIVLPPLAAPPGRISGLNAQDEPDPGGGTEPTDQPVVRKKRVPRKRPKPKKRPDGIADEFPTYPEKLVPGARRDGKTDNIVLPHLNGKSPDNVTEPPPDNKKTTPAPTLGKPKPVVKPKPVKKGPGFWASLFNRIRNDQKFINLLVLAILVAIFVIYRIRAGRSVRRKY